MAFFLLIAGNLTAADEKNVKVVNKDVNSERGRKISGNYQEGRFLIYDCKIKAFICISKQQYIRCEEERKYEINESKLYLGCAPLKEFSKTEECIVNQLAKIEDLNNKKFCYGKASYYITK
jgi:hypothetical protein